MSIYFPESDNPVDRDRLPKVELPYCFPVELTHTISVQRMHQLFIVTIQPLITLLALIPWFIYHFGTGSSFGPEIQFAVRILVLLFAGLVALRSRIIWGYMPELLICLALTLTFPVFVDAHLFDELLRPFTATLLIWSSLEFAIHWTKTNPDSGTRKSLDYRLPTAAILIVVTSVTLSISFAYAGALLLLNIGAFVIFWVGTGTPLIGFIRYAFRSFFAYPPRNATPVGSIKSPACHPILRPLPVALWLFVYVYGQRIDSTEFFFASLAIEAITGAGVGLALLCALAALCAMPLGGRTWAQKFKEVTDANRQSSNPILRNSLFLGVADADGGPVLVDRSLLLEHVHFLGRTGSGKTAMGLIPLMEQLLLLQKASLIVIDLKGDTTELAASCVAGIEARFRLDGHRLPLSVFSLESGQPTHAFNPFLVRGWEQLTLMQKSETLSNALGLQYGPGYGKDYFGDTGNTLVYTGLKVNPNIRSFRELLDEASRVLQIPKSELMLEGLKKASVHAWQATARLAAIDAINIIPNSSNQHVVDNMIDLARCFEEPRVVIIRLPSTTSAKTASAVANLFVQMLLVAGKRAERKCRVHVCIDEFQRMATDSLAQVFQLARSQGVGLIIANQSQSDLRRASETLAATVDDSCHWRQWFSVSGEEATKLAAEFGQCDEVVEVFDGNGVVRSRQTVRTQRADHASLAKMSDDPRRSVLRLTGDRVGFGKYQGLPFHVRSDFHISRDEYERRRQFVWPSHLPGLIPATESEVGLPDSPGKRPPPPPPPTDFDGGFNPDLFEE